MSHEKVQVAPLTPSEIFEFVGAVVEQIPRDLDPEKIRWYNEKKSRIGKDIRPLFAQPVPTFGLADWVRFYKKHFGLATTDWSGLHVPPKPNYPCRAIVVVPQITNNQAFDACTKAFKTWRYTDDLDSVRDVVSRPDGPYVVWVRDTVEADPDMAGKSADDIEAAGINTLTLKERLLLELKYFEETDKHLDIHNWTLCAGSRYPDGDVPSVGWSDGRLHVDWAHADSRYPALRARVAVS